LGPANRWKCKVILHDAPKLESIPVFNLASGVLAGLLDGEQGMVGSGNRSLRVRRMLRKRRRAKAGLRSDRDALVRTVDRLLTRARIADAFCSTWG
jgi:hypothetical protein